MCQMQMHLFEFNNIFSHSLKVALIFEDPTHLMSGDSTTSGVVLLNKVSCTGP
jgi:hypothetical protein